MKGDLVHAVETVMATGTSIKLCLSFESFCGCSYFRLGDLVGNWVDDGMLDKVDKAGDVLDQDR